MAQPMQCDFTGCPHVVSDTGGFIVSEVLTGDTNAWCPEHYYLVCRAIVEAAEQAEQPEQADQTDELLTAEVEAVADAAETSQDGPGAAIPAAAHPNTRTVVKRGTSPGRRAHQARKRAAAHKAASRHEVTHGNPQDIDDQTPTGDQDQAGDQTQG